MADTRLNIILTANNQQANSALQSSSQQFQKFSDTAMSYNKRMESSNSDLYKSYIETKEAAEGFFDLARGAESGLLNKQVGIGEKFLDKKIGSMMDSLVLKHGTAESWEKLNKQYLTSGQNIELLNKKLEDYQKAIKKIDLKTQQKEWEAINKEIKYTEQNISVLEKGGSGFIWSGGKSISDYGRKVKEAGGPVVEGSSKNILSKTGDAMSKVGSGLENVGESWGKYAEKTVNILNKVVTYAEQIEAEFIRIPMTVLAAQKAIENIPNGLLKARENLEGFVGELQSNPFLKAAAEIESYEVRLKSLTGSEQGAIDALKFMHSESAKGGFETRSMIDAGAIIKELKLNIEDTLPFVEKLAAGTGEELPSAAVALGNAFVGISGGFTQLQRTFHLTKDQMVQAGAATNEFNEITTETNKDLNQTVDALKKVINTNYGNVVAAQANTLNGSFQGLHNVIEKFTGEVGEVIKKPVVDFVNSVTQIVSKTASSILPLMEALQKRADFFSPITFGAKVLVKTLDSVADSVKGVTEFLNNDTILSKTASNFLALSASIATMTVALAPMVGWSAAFLALYTVVGAGLPILADFSAKIALSSIAASEYGSASSMASKEVTILAGATEAASTTGTVLAVTFDEVAVAGARAAMSVGLATKAEAELVIAAEAAAAAEIELGIASTESSVGMIAANAASKAFSVGAGAVASATNFAAEKFTAINVSSAALTKSLMANVFMSGVAGASILGAAWAYGQYKEQIEKTDSIQKEYNEDLRATIEIGNKHKNVIDSINKSSKEMVDQGITYGDAKSALDGMRASTEQYSAALDDLNKRIEYQQHLNTISKYNRSRDSEIANLEKEKKDLENSYKDKKAISDKYEKDLAQHTKELKEYQEKNGTSGKPLISKAMDLEKEYEEFQKKMSRGAVVRKSEEASAINKIWSDSRDYRIMLDKDIASREEFHKINKGKPIDDENVKVMEEEKRVQQSTLANEKSLWSQLLQVNQAATEERLSRIKESDDFLLQMGETTKEQSIKNLEDWVSSEKDLQEKRLGNRVELERKLTKLQGEGKGKGDPEVDKVLAGIQLIDDAQVVSNQLMIKSNREISLSKLNLDRELAASRLSVDVAERQSMDSRMTDLDREIDRGKDIRKNYEEEEKIIHKLSDSQREEVIASMNADYNIANSAKLKKDVLDKASIALQKIRHDENISIENNSKRQSESNARTISENIAIKESEKSVLAAKLETLQIKYEHGKDNNNEIQKNKAVQLQIAKDNLIASSKAEEDKLIKGKESEQRIKDLKIKTDNQLKILQEQYDNDSIASLERSEQRKSEIKITKNAQTQKQIEIDQLREEQKLRDGNASSLDAYKAELEISEKIYQSEKKRLDLELNLAKESHNEIKIREAQANHDQSMDKLNIERQKYLAQNAATFRAAEADSRQKEISEVKAQYDFKVETGQALTDDARMQKTLLLDQLQAQKDLIMAKASESVAQSDGVNKERIMKDARIQINQAVRETAKLIEEANQKQQKGNSDLDKAVAKYDKIKSALEEIRGKKDEEQDSDLKAADNSGIYANTVGTFSETIREDRLKSKLKKAGEDVQQATKDAYNQAQGEIDARIGSGSKINSEFGKILSDNNGPVSKLTTSLDNLTAAVTGSPVKRPDGTSIGNTSIPGSTETIKDIQGGGSGYTLTPEQRAALNGTSSGVPMTSDEIAKMRSEISGGRSTGIPLTKDQSDSMRSEINNNDRIRGGIDRIVGEGSGDTKAHAILSQIAFGINALVQAVGSPGNNGGLGPAGKPKHYDSSGRSNEDHSALDSSAYATFRTPGIFSP